MHERHDRKYNSAHSANLVNHGMIFNMLDFWSRENMLFEQDIQQCHTLTTEVRKTNVGNYYEYDEFESYPTIQ